MPSTVEIWQVYFLLCNHTKPSPKKKFIVIMCIDSTPMGILINSIINPYIKKRSWLLPCEVKLEQQKHSFLHHNSYLDCRDIFPFAEIELTKSAFKGEIDISIRKEILTAVSVCRVLPEKYKALISGQAKL